MTRRARRRSVSRWLFAIVAVLTELALAGSAAAQRGQKQVLVLYSTRRDAQIAVVGDRELPRILETGLAQGLDYYSEFIDPSRFPQPDYQIAFRNFLRLKYQEQRFDLVIAMDDWSLQLVNTYRNDLFPGTPVVFFANSPVTQPIPNSTGVIGQLDFSRTLAFALELQPEIQRVFFVIGEGNDGEFEKIARRQFRRFEPGVIVTYLAGLPTKELEARLAALPKRSIVYYGGVLRNRAGENFNSLDYLARIAEIASVPIYSWVDSTMDRGIVGGSLKSQKKQAEAVAQLALRVLNGEAADSIPTSAPDLNVAQVDWRQVRRWRIDGSRVPVGTSVLFRQPTVFEEYGSYIIGVVCLIAAESALIGGLVIQRRRRRRAEESLRESEQHFHMMADTAPVMVWRTGPDTLCDFVNKPWLEFRGRTFEDERGTGWMEGVHPEDREYVNGTFGDAFARREPFRMEYRVQRTDGQYRWLLVTGVPRRLPDGTFNGYIGSCIDITDRKMIEATLQANEAKLRSRNEEIRDLAGRLITAQEQERSRIARELHDDIGQQIALLTIELALLSRAGQNEAVSLTGEASRRVQGLARSVHDLSHRLHPTRLRLLGLVSALEALRDEFSKSGIEIGFTHKDIPSKLPADVTLCLFRIVQEGLQNALKHSGAHQVLVYLSGGTGMLSLRILDDGLGFDVDLAFRKGLGLLSMHERLEAIGGTLEISSTAGVGTELKVTVPLGGVQTRDVTAPRVLLVDDNDDMLARAGEALTPACVVAGKARNGKAALEAAEVLRPDVIVLDISMPDMTGFEVAAHLRQTSSAAAIVFLSVHEGDEYLLAARAAGAVGYVVKSRLASDLLPAVHDAQVRRRLDSVLH